MLLYSICHCRESPQPHINLNINQSFVTIKPIVIKYFLFDPCDSYVCENNINVHSLFYMTLNILFITILTILHHYTGVYSLYTVNINIVLTIVAHFFDLKQWQFFFIYEKNYKIQYLISILDIPRNNQYRAIISEIIFM